MISRYMGAFMAPFLFCSLSLAQTVKTAPMAKTPPVVPGQPNVGTVVKADPTTLDKGKRLYMANCIQCHNRDPNIKGPIGPEMVDAPLYVMTSKVMTSKYPDPLPPGFVPKRKSHAMRAIPKLKNDIPAIHAWVQSVKKKK